MLSSRFEQILGANPGGTIFFFMSLNFGYKFGYTMEICDKCLDVFPLPDFPDEMVGQPVIYNGKEFICKKCYKIYYETND